MDIIGIDLETYYDKKYSLSKISTQEYIGHPLFEVIGVAVKVNEAPAEWFSGTMEETSKWLAQFDWENSWVYAHNTLFDATILTWKFGIKPKLWIDTLSMARAVHGAEVGGSLAKLAEHYELGQKGTEVVSARGVRRVDFSEEELAKYGQYCINDVELTHGIFNHLALHFNRIEIKLIDMTIRMHTEPSFILDLPTLEDHLHHTKRRKEDLLAASGMAKEDLMSNPKFADVLRSHGVVPPMKISPTTGKETYAFAKTDEDMKALLDYPDFDVQAIVAARLGTKSTIEETRTQTFIEIAHTNRYLPIPLKYYGADVSGRWSGVSFNMQNIPRTSPIKSAIQAPEGHVIVGADLSNIELRVSLYFSGQFDKLKIIAEGKDLYKDFAASAFKVPYDEVTKDQRFVGKTSVLGLGFGTGAVKLRESIRAMSGTDIGAAEAKRIVDLYREEFSEVKNTWTKGGQVLKDMRDNVAATFGTINLPVAGRRGVLLPSGLYLKYPDLKEMRTETGTEWTYASHRGSRRKIYSGKVVQNCLSEGTLVLTDSGWKAIETVTLRDKVHDGDSFVSHRGVVFQSVQSCVSIDGVFMTPDHEVLTNEGWKTASSNPRPYRPDIWSTLNDICGALKWEKKTLEFFVRLWKSLHKVRERCKKGDKKGRASKLWMRFQKISSRKKPHSWNEQAFSLSCMGQYETTMWEQESQGLCKLWGEGNFSVRSMEGIIRKFLGGYEGHLQGGAAIRSNRQQFRVLQRELPLDNAKAEHDEQKKHYPNRCANFIKTIGYRAYYYIQQIKSGVAFRGVVKKTRLREQERKVYDIMDCGPLTRFVVLGKTGPFIVHNCVQALARCIMGEAMVRITKRYKIALTIHDSCYCVVPEDEAQEALDFIIAELCKEPTWMPGIPLGAEGAFGRTLKEAG